MADRHRQARVVQDARRPRRPWIDTSQLVERLDARFDVDRYALRYPRAFGVLVLLSALILAVSVLKR
jgi:hypothetical protein